jgi:hypothetical protein
MRLLSKELQNKETRCLKNFVRNYCVDCLFVCMMADTSMSVGGDDGRECFSAWVTIVSCVWKWQFNSESVSYLVRSVCTATFSFFIQLLAMALWTNLKTGLLTNESLIKRRPWSDFSTVHIRIFLARSTVRIHHVFPITIRRDECSCPRWELGN